MEFVSGKISLRTIFRDWWETFATIHQGKLRDSIRINVFKMMACKTLQLGAHLQRCSACGTAEPIPHTCKSRFCSSCGKKATDEWIKTMEENVKNKPQMKSIQKVHIYSALQALGLRARDRVIVHSSLKSFGHVDGGAAAVVEALVDTVGSRGLIMMPVYGKNMDAKGDLIPLDLATARITTGTVPATFCRYSGVHRSLHPLYSLAFFGAEARSLACEAERLMFPYGLNQLFRVLLVERGYVLLMGVDDKANSTIHMLEEICDPPYLQEKKSQSHLTVAEFFAMPMEKRRKSLAHHSAGPKRDFTRVVPLLDERGLLGREAVGSAVLALEPVLGLKEALGTRMSTEPTFLTSWPESVG